MNTLKKHDRGTNISTPYTINDDTKSIVIRMSQDSKTFNHTKCRSELTYEERILKCMQCQSFYHISGFKKIIIIFYSRRILIEINE
ncbi:hypothetical protein PFDG_05223 [Plasmodium falciparum Dd2]|uniref:Uncharacterized protein n=1 Tax=Plasmodium falciparum (isolate Dd2) TaxID=57267 RepID=A0A0L7MA43_PLAF4|nr:hypothetical protein PFDG_05223 [Plasmodium falciparum Dd2]